jgi:hypothetical protein
MEIATYHNHDVGSFLHAEALAGLPMSLTAADGREPTSLCNQSIFIFSGRGNTLGWIAESRADFCGLSPARLLCQTEAHGWWTKPGADFCSR